MATNETSPLIPHEGAIGQKKKLYFCCLDNVFSIENRVLLTGFAISLGFYYTQVSLLYAFHMMACDMYYNSETNFDNLERCNVKQVAVAAAAQTTTFLISTAVCGTINLFIAGWAVKKLGPREALIVQTVFSALRIIPQVIGVTIGGRSGIVIVQAAQLINIIGGPYGYILIVNIIVSEVVDHNKRTAVFGKLQGAVMFGQGIGFLAGGTIGNMMGVRAPFQVAFVTFIFASVYVRLVVPYISPEDTSRGAKASTKWNLGFFAPLKVLRPHRVRMADGTIKRHYGVAFLCAGIFLGVLATAYIPFLAQMYATAEFGFDQGENGWLMSEFSLLRGLFLVVIFPRVIMRGRIFLSRFVGMEASTMPDRGLDGDTRQTAQNFDLIFLRWSLVVDGLLTASTALATKKWHIYLVAALLPLGSGGAPAAKGIITRMCLESQRADALNAVTLVENIARLLSFSIFGLVYSSLAEVGKSYATFFCNALIAIVGAGVLLLSNFPPAQSTVVDPDENDETEQEQQ